MKPRGWGRIRILPYGAKIGANDTLWGRYRKQGVTCEYWIMVIKKARARQRGRREIQEQQRDGESEEA